MISIHPKHPTIGAHDGDSPWRYFVRSAAFRTQFSNISPDQAYAIIEANASYKKRGPIVQVDDVLLDVNGEPWDFTVESFSNTHALLTLGIGLKKRGVRFARGN
jgi:hypothetical protein